MNRYIAVIRLARRADTRASRDTVDALLGRLRGVESIDQDGPAASVLVWFNRALISLGDIVRTLEDHGVRVAAVAQSRADAGSQVHAVGA